jgi:hypothetical protein
MPRIDRVHPHRDAERDADEASEDEGAEDAGRGDADMFKERGVGEAFVPDVE